MEQTRTGSVLSGDVVGDNLVSLPAGYPLLRYQLIETLGQGTFGITYRAHDRQLDRAVAIKEYLPVALAVRHGGTQVLPRSTRLADDFRWGRERFLAEAQTLARFENTPAIVRVYDFLEANGTAYMVMELLRGETLEARLKREGRLPAPVIERLLPPLLDGLERVHETGILHRDIKPSNITIDDEGRPTLLDFGAARAAVAGRTQALTAVYTPGYAAIEQFTSAAQGPYTDIYALATTLYQCVTGGMPPNALERVMDDRLEPASRVAAGLYPSGLLAGIDAGLAVRAQDRPATIAAWRAVFDGRRPTAFAPIRAEAPPERAAHDDETYIPRAAPTKPPKPAGPARPAGSSRKWIVAALVGLLVVAGVAGGTLYVRDVREREAVREAERLAAEARQRELEAQRRAEEERQRVEQARQQAEAEARRRAAEEEEAKRQAQVEQEADAARRKAEDEARAQQDEEARRQAAETARRQAEADARRHQEEEARRQAAEDARRKAEADARRRQEDDAHRKAEADARRRQEEAARRPPEPIPPTPPPPVPRPAGVDGTWSGTVECYPGGPKGPVTLRVAAGQGSATVQGMTIALRISDSSAVSDLAWIGQEGREWMASLRGRPAGDAVAITGSARTIGGRPDAFRPQCTLNLRHQ